MTQKPDFIPTHCIDCDEPLIDSIQVCACCNDRYVAKVCSHCKRAWAWDYNLNEWVELEEVTEDD